MAVGREHGIAVIPGACPNMFGATSDPGHRSMCGLLKLTGKLPRRFEYEPPGPPAPTGAAGAQANGRPARASR